MRVGSAYLTAVDRKLLKAGKCELKEPGLQNKDVGLVFYLVFCITSYQLNNVLGSATVSFKTLCTEGVLSWTRPG